MADDLVKKYYRVKSDHEEEKKPQIYGMHVAREAGKDLIVKRR